LKLRLKLFTLFSVSYLLIFIVLQLASNSFLLRGVEELEKNDVIEDTTMGLAALNHRIIELEEAAARFSSYNDVYQYMNAKDMLSDDYILNVFNDAALSEAEINYVLLFSLEGETVFQKGYSLIGNVEMDVSDELIDFFEMNSILVMHQDRQSKLSGILKTPEGLWFMSSQPVSAGRGSIIGSIVIGREISSREADTLQESTFLSLDIVQLLDSNKSNGYEEIIKQISMDSPVFIQKIDSEMIKGYSVLNDVYGNPAVLLQVESPRLIYQQGIQMVNYFVLSFVLIGVSIGMLVLLALNRLVIMPLSKLSSEVAEINPSTINEVSVEIPGSDELSGLSKDIDKMLETLRDYQNRIKETERMVFIGATATMVGHDLRNPLQVVFMLTDLIQKRIRRLQGAETLDPELESLERLTVRIKDQAAYMNKVVSDLQGLTTGISLEIEKMDVIQLIYKVLESITLGENIEEKIIFEEDFPMIYADGTKLRRVFTNLITNAVQAMKGEGELVIRGHRVEDQIYVSVIDTGDGIAEEYLDKIFDPLFTTKAKGTGLGLTVCKLITESHGGDIVVKSYPGSGSRFTVILPIHNSQDEVNQIQETHMEYAMPQGHILPSCL